MTWNVIFALLGGVLLAGVGGELFVRGLVGLARWLRVPPGIIGATIAAFATSSPELSVAISSASDGHPQISLGDVLGSNVVNVAVILGIALVIAPIHCERGNIMRDFSGAMLVPVVTGLLVLDGLMGRVDACVLLVLFAGWLGAAIRDARRRRDPTGEVLGRRPALLAAGSSFGGLLCLFAGGRLIVIGAEGVAVAFGISEFVIGATVVALGTSVPELATVIISQVRGHRDISLGLILGSNIFNGLVVISTAAIICPIPTVSSSVIITLIVGLVAVAVTYPAGNGFIGRSRGLFLLLFYFVYVAAVLKQTP